MRFRIALLSLALLAACGHAATVPPSSVATLPVDAGRIMPPVSDPSSAPLPTVAPTRQDQVLAVLEHRGGFCAGPCVNIETVALDGTITRTDPQGTHPGGTVAPERLSALKAAIAAADWASLKAAPLPPDFLCPTASDGTESVYTFVAAGTKHEIASCSVSADPASSPYLELHDALADLGVQ